jgi:hypothetical protein
MSVVAGPQRNLAAIRVALAARGVGEPCLTELVHATWVTQELIDAWWRYIDTWENADDRVRVASLIQGLRRRAPPPECRGSEGGRGTRRARDPP